MRKVIFWDFDGTLTVSNHLWSRSVHRALGPLAEEYGITFEAIGACLHTGFPWHNDGPAHLKGKSWWKHMTALFSGVYQQLGVPARLADRAAEAVRGKVLSSKSYQVYPDAASVLAVCLYKGYENYLLSNNYPELEEVLERLYLRPFFTGLIVSGKIDMEKPNRKIFDHAFRKAGEPEVCWMVGDNPKADVAGAKQLGWYTALVHSEGKSQADLTTNTLTQLLRYF